MKRILLLTIIILLIGCKLFNKSTPEEPDNPPEKISQLPVNSNLTGKVNDSIELHATFQDLDGDPINYKGLNNGVEVPLIVNGNTAKYVFNVDETGNYSIQIIGYNAYADTAKWNIGVGNTFPNVGELQDIGGFSASSLSILVVQVNLEVKLTQQKNIPGNGDFNLALDDQNRIILENYVLGSNGTITATLEVTDTEGGKKSKSFVYTINPMDDFKGYLKNIKTGEKEPGVLEVDGILVETDGQGNFEFQMTPITDHILKAQGYNVNDKTTTVRERTTEGNQDL